jgi:hypothetical protein
MAASHVGELAGSSGAGSLPAIVLNRDLSSCDEDLIRGRSSLLFANAALSNLSQTRNLPLDLSTSPVSLESE